ncbi:hypothetical protein OL229_14190 [Neisseriaceae bacterium JH1-16]|nr:hypothetical protein [Neisseriaceae bacterium JH1-16]
MSDSLKLLVVGFVGASLGRLLSIGSIHSASDFFNTSFWVVYALLSLRVVFFKRKA